MQVKKFEAPTIQEALENIKRELGPEAIILQTKKNKKGFGLMSKGSVEVTAAISERSLQKKGFTEKRLPEASRESIQKLPAARQADVYDKYMDRHLRQTLGETKDRVEVSRAAAQKPITVTRYADIDDEDRPVANGKQAQMAKATLQARATQLAARLPAGAEKAPLGFSGMSIEEEVRHLKRMIEEIKGAQDEIASGGGANSQFNTKSGLAPALQDGFEQLVLNGVDKRFALPLIRKVSFELGEAGGSNPEDVCDQIAAELMESSAVMAPISGIEPRAKTGSLAGPVVIALVGPTGVGKTTTIAKMASEALLRRSLKVGLINLDSYKVAAFDQLATYAKILNVPFRSASSSEDLRSAVADFKSLDVVIVDTTGRSQKDPVSLKEMEEMLKQVPGIQTHLVLSATTRDAELYDMAQRFSVFLPQGVIISKLDEATTFGSIYNVSQKTKLPLLYFTTGQRVPEDIEEASKERIAALILDL